MYSIKEEDEEEKERPKREVTRDYLLEAFFRLPSQCVYAISDVTSVLAPCRIHIDIFFDT